MTADFKAALQSTEVNVKATSSLDTVNRAVEEKLHDLLAKALDDFRMDVRPLVLNAFARIARPLEFPVGDQVACMELKIVALARTPAGPYVPYTMETVHDRSYPLFDEIYMYVDQAKDRSLAPKVKEFLRFIVSREGQEAVQRDGKYLPLTAAVAREQLRKLDGAASMAKTSQ